MATRIFALSLGIVLCAGADAARADWYALSNETAGAVVVQEVVSVRGQAMKVKPKRLSPGETVRELILRPAEKHLVISDALRPGPALFDGKIACEPGHSQFVIRESDGRLELLRVSPSGGDPLATFVRDR